MTERDRRVTPRCDARTRSVGSVGTGGYVPDLANSELEATLPTGAQVDAGMLVVHPALPGVAHVGDVRGSTVRLDLFDSAANPIAGQHWVDREDVRRCQVGIQTRVFWKDPATARWVAGRVVGGGP